MIKEFDKALYDGRRYSSERRFVLSLASAALKAIDPAQALRRHITVDGDILIAGAAHYVLSSFEHIYVVGAGKACAPMAEALEDLLGSRITGGHVNIRYGNSGSTSRITLFPAGHPLPDGNSLKGTERIISILENSTERDLVICLLSGGASALLAKPEEGILPDEMAQTTDALLRCGATIQEINTVRKHLDIVKGGKLARMARPSPVLSLILSDVVGPDDPLPFIASGPTAPDSSSYQDALSVLSRYHLAEEIPESMRCHLMSGRDGLHPENPGADDPIFKGVHNIIIGSCSIAAEETLCEASKHGLNTLLLTTSIQSEAKETAAFLVSIAREIRLSGRPVCKPALLVAAGETTVCVRGRGMGGRNQELALAAAIHLRELEGVIVASIATDGSDGPTDAAGAIVDCETFVRGANLELDAYGVLDDNDSYHYLRETRDLIITGATNSNVNDLYLVYVF
ncbi:MAG: glycerate kinase [Candidatus Xenobiia bacterium LiM19]